MAIQGRLGITLLKPSHKEAPAAVRSFSPSRRLTQLGFSSAAGCSLVTLELPRLMTNYSRHYQGAKPDDEIEEDKAKSFNSLDSTVDAGEGGSENDDPFLMTDEERHKLRRKIRDVIDNAPDVEEEQDLEERKRKMKNLLANYPLVVEEDDPDWPDDADGWGFNLDQFFNKITIKNTKKNDDDDSYDSDKEIVWQDDNYIRPIRDITSKEWDDTVFKDFNPLVILVHNRYKRPHENERARVQLEKAVQMFWQTGLPSPRCVAIDAVVEQDLVSILRVSGFPEILFTKAGKILHRDRVVRTADEWSKMMAFFYYKAVRPSCIDKSVGENQEKIPSL